ncbi:hypothetical protein FPQ18DRAFT_309711 [Pyronema domesticum]|nr:hypothetical protein FPQ18DRAFT_309711 [Pyronema domesticum]
MSEYSCHFMWTMIPQKLSRRKGNDLSKLGIGEGEIMFRSRLFAVLMGATSNVPCHGVQFFCQILQRLSFNWKTLLEAAEKTLDGTNDDLLKSKGQSPKNIDALLNDAQQWTQLEKLLSKHQKTMRKYVKLYKTYPFLLDEVRFVKARVKASPLPIDIDSVNIELEEAMEPFYSATPESITKLSQRTAAVIQLEFNLVSIHEAQKSTSMAASMKRLSWVTFIFLPLSFVGTLMGMNIDLLDGHPGWWWYLVLSIAVLLLVFTGWIVFKYMGFVLSLFISIECFLKKTVGKRLEILAQRWSEREEIERDLEAGQKDKKA